MKITAIESLHADAGQRNFDFLKITTDAGLVGWSEYNESFGGPGVSTVIAELAPSLGEAEALLVRSRPSRERSSPEKADGFGNAAACWALR